MGKKLWLVTSGGTKVPIDTVRDITNMSKGTFGSKIMTEALKQNQQVWGLIASGSKTPFDFRMDLREVYPITDEAEYTMEAYQSFTEAMLFARRYSGNYIQNTYRNFEDYEQTLFSILENKRPDVVVLAAAVSDYGVKPMEGKLRSGTDLTIELQPLPKLISRVKKVLPKCCLVGFKLLVGSTQAELEEAAWKSIEMNGCDIVVGNDLRDIKGGKHRLTIAKKSNELFTYETDPDDPNFLARMVVNSAMGVLNSLQK